MRTSKDLTRIKHDHDDAADWLRPHRRSLARSRWAVSRSVRWYFTANVLACSLKYPGRLAAQNFAMRSCGRGARVGDLPNLGERRQELRRTELVTREQEVGLRLTNDP